MIVKWSEQMKTTDVNLIVLLINALELCEMKTFVNERRSPLFSAFSKGKDVFFCNLSGKLKIFNVIFSNLF